MGAGLVRMARCCVAAGALILLLPPSPLSSQDQEKEQEELQTVEEVHPIQTVPQLIQAAASRHGISPDLMLRIAWCESRYRPYVVSWSGYVGTFQWGWSSFQEEARWYGVSGVSPYEPYWNIELAAFALANGRAWRWRACL